MSLLSPKQTSFAQIKYHIFIIELTNLTFTHCKLCVKNRVNSVQLDLWLEFLRSIKIYSEKKSIQQLRADEFLTTREKKPH